MRQPDARRRAEDELRAFAREQVRTPGRRLDEVEREVAEAIDVELPGTDSAILARAWVAAEVAAWKAERA